MAWIAPVAMGVASLVGGWISAHKQKKENRRIAETQNAANTAYLDKQLAYNTPQNQMQRYQDAGLNPNLVYGQGNPGSQAAPQQAADIRPTDYQKMFGEALPMMNQTSLIQSQVQANNAKTRQVGVLTSLNQLQIRVLEKNPLLSETGYNAIIDGLKASAETKQAEAGMKSMENEFYHMQGIGKHGGKGGLTLGEYKMFTELDLLEQRFQLGSADAKIKAEVLNSKEFQNAILEVQKKFMTDAEITPQHIYQFIQLLLMKIL